MGLTLSAWALFALTATLIELTPGPNMAYLAIVAVSQGRKPGYAAAVGVSLGLAIVGIAAALGVAAAINASPLLYQVLRWGGVIYLFWLAYEGWRDANEEIEHAPLGSSNMRYFRRGLITNLLNPKAQCFISRSCPDLWCLRVGSWRKRWFCRSHMSPSRRAFTSQLSRQQARCVRCSKTRAAAGWCGAGCRGPWH